MPEGWKKALWVEYIKQDIKRNNLSPPPLLCSSHWMPPHWSPLRPWLPAGVPLTFNLWPPAPQNSSQSRQLDGLSGERILRNAVMTTERSDSEYRCYHWVQVLQMFFRFCCPFPLIFTAHCIHKITEILSVSVTLWICVCVWVCVSQSHLSWCSWVKESILLFLDGKLPATKRSGYKSAVLSSLLKKHVPALCSYVGRWNFFFSSLLLVFFSI